MIYLTAVGYLLGGSSSVHIYTQTIQRTTQKYIEQHKKHMEQHKNEEKCGPCPVFASFTLAFALQLKKKQGRTSVRVAFLVNTTIQWQRNMECCVASGFRSDVDEICVLLGYYAAYSGNSLPTFRDKSSVPYS